MDPDLPPQTPLQRLQHLLHILRRGSGTHQTDAPDLSFHRTEAGADLDVEIGEELLAHAGFVRPFGHRHGVELPELMAFLRSDAETEFLQAGLEREMILFVATPAVFQSFLE